MALSKLMEMLLLLMEAMLSTGATGLSPVFDCFLIL